MKKAKFGDNTPTLRKGQYKRIGRLEAKNPERAARVTDRMLERETRVARGKAFASPKLATSTTPRSSMKKGGKISKKKK